MSVCDGITRVFLVLTINSLEVSPRWNSLLASAVGKMVFMAATMVWWNNQWVYVTKQQYVYHLHLIQGSVRVYQVVCENTLVSYCETGRNDHQ